MADLDEGYDVVVVGSGIAGLAAALSASEAGLRPVVLEKAPVLGGGTTYSYGLIWTGLNHLAAREGVEDRLEDVVRYMRFLGGGYQLEERMQAFVLNAPKVLRFYETCGIRFRLVKSLGDVYYGKAEGAVRSGRTVEHDLIRAEELGRWKDLVRRPPMIPARLLAEEMLAWGGLHNVGGFDQATLKARTESDTLGLGVALIAGFVKALAARGVAMKVDAGVERLAMEGGRCVGVELRDGRRIGAAKGVLLATGGYESSDELVANYEGLPRFLSMFPAELTGDGLVMAAENGASVQIVHQTLRLHLGFAVPKDEGGRPEYRAASLMELCSPHTLVANRAGKRFANEAYFQSVAAAIRSYDIDRHEYVNLPCFLIFDQQYVDRFSFAGLPVGSAMPEWVARGGTLSELAGRLGIDGRALEATARRFNGFVAEGRDGDFGRGGEGWRLDGRIGTPSQTRLGTVEAAPFYGVELRPSAVASAGLETDIDGRVLHQRRRPIPGLYASGNLSAHTEIGVGYQAGLSISAGMTFSHLAVQHMAAAARQQAS